MSLLDRLYHSMLTSVETRLGCALLLNGVEDWQFYTLKDCRDVWANGQINVVRYRRTGKVLSYSMHC